MEVKRGQYAGVLLFAPSIDGGSVARMAAVPVDLRCERLIDPIGVGTPAPRLSWRIEAETGSVDVVQVAAQITLRAAGSDDVLWDSGVVDGWRMQMRYGGPPFSSRSRYRWRVRVWTVSGSDASRRSEAVSDEAQFELGLLSGREWTARMIRPAARVSTAAVRFSTDFEVPRNNKVVCARLYLTAHGIVTPLLNGREVTDEILTPGWTSYRHRLPVRTLDVTAHVQPGRNALACIVAPGWFNGRLGFRNERALYGDHVGVLAQFEAVLASGDRIVIGTGEDGWTAATTPWVQADVYDGETYDARTAPTTMADDAAHVGVEAIELDLEKTFVAPPVPPVRRTQTLVPRNIRHIDDNTVAVDVGQNIVGWLRVTLGSVPPGTQITLRHAEILDPDGRLFTAPLRTAKATDRYVAAGTGRETYEPRFTFHGFRYAEISGVPATALLDIEAVVIHTDLEPTGTFTCSDARVNRLHENVIWGWRGNSVSVPTDCPQRDERLGWTGDIQVFAPTAAYLYDCQTFLENWLADLRADQRDSGAVPAVVPDIGGLEGVDGLAGWGDAAVVVPWVLYEMYGDDTVLRDALPSMVAWIDYVQSRLVAGIWTSVFQFGDWLDPDAPPGQPWKAKASADLVATAYAARACDLLARAATVLEDAEIARANAERFVAIRQAWWARFGEEAARTQTGCALALQFDLVPDDDRRRLGNCLATLVHDAGDHLATGFLGTPLLLPALSRVGHDEVAYALLHQDSVPSWLYQVKAGATTIWERWDALRPDGSVPLDDLAGANAGSMVSYNHYAYGSVADWLHRTVLGIAPDARDPAFHHIIVAPRPGGGITSASGSLATRFGLVRVAWCITEGELRLDLDVPANARATVRLPRSEPTVVGSGHWSFRDGLGD